MISMTATRWRLGYRMPRVGGLIAIASLTIAFQSCAMAFAGEHACPDCPPPIHQDCDSDSSEQSSCIYQIDHDARLPQLIPASGSAEVTPPVSVPWPSAESLVFASTLAVVSAGLVAPKVNGPPLNVRFCVYLK